MHPAILLPLALLTGFVLGLAHFATLRLVSEDYAAGRAGRAALVQLLRMAIVVAVLYALARLGAGALLAGALGLLAARAILLRRARRQS